jgi:glycosyltransferase involved in cell wall biosynthesis
MNNSKTSSATKIYIVWKGYQRRAEVLASLLGAELKFFPHHFESKFLRMFDYFIKLVANIHYLSQNRVRLVIVQAPPLFAAIPALILGIPYVIDAHNPVFQGFWGKLPLTRYLIFKAQAVIVHNSEILQLAEKRYPSLSFLKVADPIEFIPPSKEGRREKQILIICSFDTWDEPIDLLIKCINKLPDYTFVITADVNKLSTKLGDKLKACTNIRLTGFLPTSDYHALLTSSLAALVLTTSEATQPSGACEALSSDTQLIVSETSLTRELFGEWAILIDNSVDSIVTAVNSLHVKSLDLTHYRNQWNLSVQEDMRILYEHIE